MEKWKEISYKLEQSKNEIKIIKRYPYRQARVRPKFIVPRQLLSEFEDYLIWLSKSHHDNHTVYLLEMKVFGAPTQRIAFYFHDFGIMIGNESDIVEMNE
jgi:hypothetical protein